MECNCHCNCSYCYRIAQVLRASTIIVNHFTTEQQLKTHKNDKSLLISVENNFQTNYINNKKSGVIFVSTQPTNFKADEQKISLSLCLSFTENFKCLTLHLGALFSKDVVHRLRCFFGSLVAWLSTSIHTTDIHIK